MSLIVFNQKLCRTVLILNVLYLVQNVSLVLEKNSKKVYRLKTCQSSEKKECSGIGIVNPDGQN